MFTDFYEAYTWLSDHPLFQEEHQVQYRDSNGEDHSDTFSESHFMKCINIQVAKVNPETLAISEDETKNTKVQIWLECGQFDIECNHHDIELDCGADTFELAIIELANLVMKWYGETKWRIKKSNWQI